LQFSRNISDLVAFISQFRSLQAPYQSSSPL
jgi:hypothetical protein